MLKRIYAFCLILALTISLVTALPVSAASDSDIQLLGDLGIIDISQKTGLIPVGYNRSDFARSLCLMERNDSGISVAGEGAAAYASDISNNKNCNYIASVISAGYMKTDSEGKFNPGTSVTMNDAVIALVKLLGYEPMAKANGGTYDAYYSIALKIGLMSGVSVQDSNKLTVQETAEMMTNAMGAHIFYPDNIDYGEKCLWDRWNLSVNTGKILANSNMGMLVERTDSNYVNIDGNIYYTRLLIENELVGSNVTYYTLSGDMGDEVVSIYIRENSDTVTLNPHNIESISDNGTILTIRTDERKNLKVDKKGFLIVNGKTMSPSVTIFNAFESGTATFVDSDNNGSYDVIHMTLLFQTIIGGVNAGSEKLATRYDNYTINFDLMDNYEIYIGKKSATLSELSAGMPVGIACDTFSIKNGKFIPDFSGAEYIRLYASSRNESGSITAMLDDDKFEIEEMTKRFGSGYKRLVADKHIPALKVGQNVTAYFDNLGQLTYFEVNKEGALRYGYLIAAANRGGTLRKTTEVKILDTDGKFNIFAAGKSFVLDGKKVDSGKTVYSVNSADDVDLTKRQLVRYRAESGILKEIDTTVVRDSYEDKETSLDSPAGFSFDPKVSGNTTKRIRSGAVDRRYAFVSDCVMFVDESDVNDPYPSEDMFVVRKASSLDTTEIYMAGYDANVNNELACIVRYSGYSSSSSEKKSGLGYHICTCYVVEKVKNTMDKNGDWGWTVTLAGDNKKASYFVPDNVKLYVPAPGDGAPLIDAWNGESLLVKREDAENFDKVIKSGDIVRFQTNTSGDINYIEKMFDFESHKDANTVKVPERGGQIYCFANLKNISGNNILYGYDNGDDDTRYVSRASTKFTVVPLYHVSTGEVELLPVSQIPSEATGNYARCFIRYYNYGVVMDNIFYVYD